MANQGPAAGTAKRHGWRRSPADEQLLDFAARFGALTVRHAAKYCYRGVFETARRRVAFMAGAGLLERSDNLAWAGTVVYPTMAGLTAIRTPGHPELRFRVPGEERMLHRLLVAETALAMLARGAARGFEVVSERQFRALERARDDGESAHRYAELVGVRTTARTPGEQVVHPSFDDTGRPRWWAIPLDNGQALHWPDFVVVGGGLLRAVEVEITPKERWRLHAVLRGYRTAIRCGHIDQVLWCVTPDVQMQLEGARGPDGWIDGLLQEMGLLPPGPPDWTVKGRPMVVRPIAAVDEGLVYALSQRVLVASMRSSYRQWRQWRRVWENSGTALDFDAWLAVPGTVTHLKSLR
ncbi:hypothetical protein [Nocardia tenerifensis]|nr:hypothetical protein [Nocardia tenerifensis]